MLYSRTKHYRERGQKLELSTVIERVTRRIAPGRTPSFNEVHVFKALEIVSLHGHAGRTRLARGLRLGEGATRTLVKHLRREGLIKVSRQGIGFSGDGQRLFSDLRSRVSEGVEIPNSPLTVGPFNIAVLVRDAAHKVRKGVEQRDMAIKVGASGATTLVFSNNELGMPSAGEDVFGEIQSLHGKLMSELGPKENDVIVIGSGDDKTSAEFGAKMAALDLLKPTD